MVPVKLGHFSASFLTFQHPSMPWDTDILSHLEYAEWAIKEG